MWQSFVFCLPLNLCKFYSVYLLFRLWSDSRLSVSYLAYPPHHLCASLTHSEVCNNNTIGGVDRRNIRWSFCSVCLPFGLPCHLEVVGVCRPPGKAAAVATTIKTWPKSPEQKATRNHSVLLVSSRTLAVYVFWGLRMKNSLFTQGYIYYDQLKY